MYLYNRMLKTREINYWYIKQPDTFNKYGIFMKDIRHRRIYMMSFLFLNLYNQWWPKVVTGYFWRKGRIVGDILGHKEALWILRMFYFMTWFEACSYFVVGHQAISFMHFWTYTSRKTVVVVENLYAQSYFGRAETKYLTWNIKEILSEGGCKVRLDSIMHSNASIEILFFSSLK